MISTIIRRTSASLIRNSRLCLPYIYFEPVVSCSFSSHSQLRASSRLSVLQNHVVVPRRAVVTSPVLKADAEWVDVVFVLPNGKEIPVKGKVGDNLLDVVVNNNVDLDGFGACEGTLSCSTCHLIFEKEDFDKIDEKITDEEMDMLDMAYGLTDTSRLGCQVCLTKKLNGVRVKAPAGVHDQRS